MIGKNSKSQNRLLRSEIRRSALFLLMDISPGALLVASQVAEYKVRALSYTFRYATVYGMCADRANKSKLAHKHMFLYYAVLHHVYLIK